MSRAEFRRPPSTEQLKISEARWGHVAGDNESFARPASHEQELRRTVVGFAAGRVEIFEREDAKKGLRKLRVNRFHARWAARPIPACALGLMRERDVARSGASADGP